MRAEDRLVHDFERKPPGLLRGLGSSALAQKLDQADPRIEVIGCERRPALENGYRTAMLPLRRQLLG